MSDAEVALRKAKRLESEMLALKSELVKAGVIRRSGRSGSRRAAGPDVQKAIETARDAQERATGAERAAECLDRRVRRLEKVCNSGGPSAASTRSALDRMNRARGQTVIERGTVQVDP